MNTLGIIVSTVAVALGITIAVAFFTATPEEAPLDKAIGTNPIENYVPAIQYNEGYYSELPIETTSSFEGASASFSGAVTMGNASSTGNSQIGSPNAVRCLITFATDASTTRMYWSSNAAGAVTASTTRPTGC